MTVYEANQKVASIRKGDILHLFYQKGNPNNKRIHVIAIIEAEKLIVSKHWLKHKKRWCFEVSECSCFWHSFRGGYMKFIKRGKK
jgi:hypothetical protein